MRRNLYERTWDGALAQRRVQDPRVGYNGSSFVRLTTAPKHYLHTSVVAVFMVSFVDTEVEHGRALAVLVSYKLLLAVRL